MQQKNKLFVGGLPYSMGDDELKELFAACGEIEQAVVIFDRATNRSKGFGFVTFTNDADAEAAVTKLNDTEVGGRKIVVNVARPREERPPRDNNRW